MFYLPEIIKDCAYIPNCTVFGEIWFCLMPFIKRFTIGKLPKETSDEFVRDIIEDKLTLQCLSVHVSDLV